MGAQPARPQLTLTPAMDYYQEEQGMCKGPLLAFQHPPLELKKHLRPPLWAIRGQVQTNRGPLGLSTSWSA